MLETLSYVQVFGLNYAIHDAGGGEDGQAGKQCRVEGSAGKAASRTAGSQCVAAVRRRECAEDQGVDVLRSLASRSTGMRKGSVYGNGRLKRVVEFPVALLMLILLAPIMLLLAMLVWIRLGTPVIFKQVRPGRDGLPFAMMKFRSMHDIRGVDGELLPDSQRLDRFGHFLRASSLDELPELWNVLVGDMSLVGPRPLLTEYLSLYSPEQRRRQLVRPGITGWAQVNGRNSVTWSERFALDVWYVDNASLYLDARILTITLYRVLRRQGINAPGEATMRRFRGNDNK